MSDTKLKCPFCQQELEIGGVDGILRGCPKCRNLGTEMLWQELERTHKALDSAIDVIQTVAKMSDKLSRKYGDTLVEQLDTIQAFCWEQGYILTHDEDFKRSEQINNKEQQ